MGSDRWNNVYDADGNPRTASAATSDERCPRCSATITDDGCECSPEEVAVAARAEVANLHAQLAAAQRVVEAARKASDAYLAMTGAVKVSPTFGMAMAKLRGVLDGAK
jgi:hypothetical protein